MSHSTAPVQHIIALAVQGKHGAALVSCVNTVKHSDWLTAGLLFLCHVAVLHSTAQEQEVKHSTLDLGHS